MSAVVGIDLGTTNTVVGTVQAGRAMALANERGERLIPSVVSFHPGGNVLVGKDAKLRRLQDAPNTVYSTKRLIGRTFGSEEVRKARARSAFQLQEGPGHGVLVQARGETYTLSEISAFVLREGKRVAEAALHDKVERAVITVPANFNDLQRAATKVAGHIAGLEVMRILNEPTAAALAYGYGKATQERIAVYDFGGGTFDVTLLDLAGNVFEVISTAGDTFLGGDDVDLLVADRIAEKFLKTHRYDPRSDRQVFEHLLAAAEEIKIALSANETATVELKELAYGVGGKALDMPFSMTRAELDELVGPLVDRTLKVCSEALTIARLEPRNLDQVIIVGGSTRTPLVRRKVAEFFGRKPLDHLSPDEVVAMGAAIQAAALTGSERRRASTGSGVSTLDSVAGQRKGRAGGTHPGLGASPTGRTQPGMGDGEPTEVHTRPPGIIAPPPARTTGSAPTTLVSGKDKYEGPGRVPSTAQGTPRISSTSDIPLPLVGADSADDDTQTGVRPPLADIPTELRSASVMFGEIGGPLGDAGAPSHAPATKPRQPPPPPPGVTTARMPSAPPLGPPDRRMGSAPAIAVPPAGPVGTTTARLASAPPPPVPPPVRGPKGTLVQTDAQPGGLAAAAVAGAAAGALAGAAVGPMRPVPPIAPAIPPAPPSPAIAAAPPLPPAPKTVAQAPAAVPAAAAVPARAAGAPLLLDVTPLSLAVETVSGYCDVIIERNTPVPCERTRMFATASDNQTAVNINVAQGESNRFGENVMLGHVELSGIRPAARGEVQIAVTFEIDADGILGVKAVDQATGKQTSAKIRLGGAVPSQAEMDQMRQRMAARQ